MLEILAFTGVDKRVIFNDLVKICAKYPKVEFGILVGSSSGSEDHGIFPSLNVVRSFRRASQWKEWKSALHLCGRWSREVTSADGATGVTYDLCSGFDRIQINLHGDYFDPRYIEAAAAPIKAFADNLAELNPDVRVILQHRGPWSEVPVIHPNVEYLFDRSEGGGRAAFHEWPDPADDKRRYGYAGGIGPDTIGEAMAFVNRFPTVRMWLDMEGRVRSDGWFDLKKVRSVCEQAFSGD